MSYRDPKIIVDQSAEIYAQGANQLGQTMNKFVDDTFKTKLEETGLRIKQVNAIGEWAQKERDLADVAIADRASGMASGLVKGYIDIQTKEYNELISRQAKARIDPASTTQKERDWIQKQGIILKSQGAAVEDMRVQLKLNNEESEANVSDGTISPDVVYKSIEDKLSQNALNNVEIAGVTSEKTWLPRNEDGQLFYKITSKIDGNTDFGKKIIEAWGLTVDDNGFAAVEQVGDPANLESPFIKVPAAYDSIKNDVVKFIENGKLGELAFWEHSTFSKNISKNESGNITVTSRNGIFNEEGFRAGITDAINAYASSIVSADPPVQRAYIDSRIPLEDGGLMTKEKWNEEYPTVEARVNYIAGKVMDKQVKFAKNQLRSRDVTDQDIKNKMPGDAAGKIWYDPTVVKEVSPPAVTPGTKFSAEGAIGSYMSNVQNTLDVMGFEGKYDKKNNIVEFDSLETKQQTDASGATKNVTAVTPMTYDLNTAKGMQDFINIVVNNDESLLGQGNGNNRDAIKRAVLGYFNLNPN